MMLFENLHCVDILRTHTRQSKERFVQVPALWSDYNSSYLLFAPTPIVLRYHSISAIQERQRSLMLRIAVAESCVCSLMSYFTSPLIDGLVDFANVLEGSMDLVQVAVLPSMLRDMDAFIANFGLFSNQNAVNLNSNGCICRTITVKK